MRSSRRIDDILDSEVIETQIVLTHQHLILGKLATDDGDLRDSGNGQQLVPQVIFGVGADLEITHLLVR